MADAYFETITVERVLFTNGAEIKVDDDTLLVTHNGHDIVVQVDDARIVVESGRVRVDGGDRVEIHADQVTRIDAGGVGDTFTPFAVYHYYPWYGHGYRPYPPEHPDSGGISYSVDWEDLPPEYRAEYYARFPQEVPDDEE